MEDHRLPAHRQQVLVGDLGERKQARAGPAGEDDPLHRCSFDGARLCQKCAPKPRKTRGDRGHARYSATAAISALTTPGTAAPIQGSRPPATEIAWAITEAAHSTIDSPIPSAT